jgi:hypothetical protein
MGPPSGGFPAGPPSGGFPAGPPSGGFPPGAAPSPYGGMPPGAPPQGQNKTPLYIAIGVVVAAALVGLIVVLTNDDDGGETTSPTTEQTATTGNTGNTSEPGGTTDTTDDAPSGAAEIEVVETGFQNIMGGWDRDEKTATYGFIIENTGDELATDISINVSVYDADGTALASDSQSIYVLRPGEQMGIGDEFYGENFASDVDRIDVQVSEPSDYSRDDVPDEGSVTADGITTSTDDYGVTTKFTVTSTYDQQLDSPYGYAIYRNADGDIIGGSGRYLDFIPANGSVAAEVSSYEVVPNIATTEVFIDPGWF